MAGDVVGTQLRAARDRVGLSTQEVSDRLKLTVRMVEAIEAHDRRWLPTNVYLRGYVRRYAKLLGLDPEPLVAAYGVETSVPADDSVVWWDGAASAARSLPVMIAGGGLVAAVVVLLLVWLWPRDDNAAAPVADLSPPSGESVSAIAGRSSGGADAVSSAPTASSDAGSVEGFGEQTNLPVNADATLTPDPEGDAPVAGSEGVVSAGASAQEVLTEEVVMEEAVAGGTDAEPSVAEAVVSYRMSAGEAADTLARSGDLVAGDGAGGEPAERRPVTGAGSQPARVGDLFRVRRITPFGDDELWFEFAEECWVEVFDTEEQPLYQDLLRRRQTLRLIGGGPFQIRLGYAPGVTLEYNGERVPLAPHTRNNVASLVVGQ